MKNRPQINADTDPHTLTATDYKEWEAQMPPEVKEKWQTIIKAENRPDGREAFDELLKRAAKPTDK